MPLTPPPLDARTFKDLLDEARARLPRFTPEWTNFNDSDPGMALVQLHAWLTETILYELNRVPDLNYLKFLELLGVVPEPARPARTELVFTLKDPERVTVSIPRLTRVAVDDPDLPANLDFETDRTLIALDAAVGALIVPSPEEEGERDLVTRFEKGAVSWAYNFAPFGNRKEGPVALYLGLRLRPSGEDKPEDRFPAGPLDLYFDAAQIHDAGPGPGAEPIQGPMATSCPAPGTASEPPNHLRWEVFTGTGDENDLFQDHDQSGWTVVHASVDETQALSRSGHVVLEIPEGVTALRPLKLATEFWGSFGETRPPSTGEELLKQLDSGPLDILPGLANFWEKMGATPAQIDELAACDEDLGNVASFITKSGIKLDPSLLSLAEWLQVSPDYEVALPRDDQDYLRLYWLRAVLDKPERGPTPATLRAVHLNTVPATQASTRLDDRLGHSDGRPAQVFRLPKTPVLIDPATGQPDLELHISEPGRDPAWQRVDDFYLSGPDDAHYLLDPESGEIHLGDGRRGRIPVAGAAVAAVRYRVGGGALGNVGTGVVSKLKGGLRHVKAVHNLRAAHDGSDAETLDAVRLRAPHDLRMRDRAVTAQDFSDLAMRTPGVALHKTLALARRAVVEDELVEKDGAVTLLVLPRKDELMPQPDEDQRRTICRWLEPRRLITTELHVIGPRYARITALEARLSVASDHDLGAVTDAVMDALLDFLSPLTGGRDGSGWPFGADIYYSDLYQRMLAVPGVLRAAHLSVEIDGVLGNTKLDIAPMPEGHLPALSRDAIELVAAYD